MENMDFPIINPVEIIIKNNSKVYVNLQWYEQFNQLDFGDV